jgi:hypothetical protein
VRPDRPFAGAEPADPNASAPSHAQVSGGANSATVPDVGLVAAPVDPNAPAELADAHAEPEQSGANAEPEPDTLTATLGVVAEAPGLPAAQPSASIALATPASTYGESANPYSRYQVVPVPDSWVPRADEILTRDPFTEPDGESPPPIWGAFRELVESTVDATDRESVLRAGWLALRGEIGEGA